MKKWMAVMLAGMMTAASLGGCGSTGSTATIAPFDVPVAVDIRQQVRNAINGRNPALRLTAVISHVSPSTRPLWRSSCESTPARMNANTITQRVSFWMLLITAFSNSSLFFARRNAVHIPARPAIQKRTSDTLPVTAMTIMIARKARSGMQAPKVPP